MDYFWRVNVGSYSKIMSIKKNLLQLIEQNSTWICLFDFIIFIFNWNWNLVENTLSKSGKN